MFGTTLHYFLAEERGLDAAVIENALKNLRRQFALQIQNATFEGRKGYTISVHLPEIATGNSINHGQNVSGQLRELLALAQSPRPVFPPRYRALRGPRMESGDMLLAFPARRAANA